jgi:formate dehydrogenase assembly factor FdhD
LCCPRETPTLQCGFYVSEGAIENECKIKEMESDVAVKIKYTKLYYITLKM